MKDLDTIKGINSLQLIEIIILIIGILVAIKFVVELIDWFKKRFDLKSGKSIKQEEYHNRIDNVESSLKEMNDSIKSIATNQNTVMNDLTYINKRFDEIETKIDYLEEQAKGAQEADIEIMHDRISQRCKHYIEINGIPENEYEDFLRFFSTYESRGGNHGLKDKVEYCKNNLPII